MSQHTRKECKHGNMVEQCRCPGPRKLIIVPCTDPDKCEANELIERLLG